jgi:hypothetical protein
MRLAEILPFAPGGRVDELDAYPAFAPERSARPDAEAVVRPLLEADTEEAFVVETGVLLIVPRVGEPDIVRVTLKRTVLPNLHAAESLPALQRIREFERAVLDQLRIQASVRSEVDVFEEDAVHRRLNRRARLGKVDVEFTRRSGESNGPRQCEGSEDSVDCIHIINDLAAFIPASAPVQNAV